MAFDGITVSAMVKELSLLSSCDYPIIFYEAPHRLIKTLKNMLSVFGNRNISISKEISKLHEMIFTGTLEEAISLFKDVKGEFVIVVDKSYDVDNNNDIDIIDKYLNKEHMDNTYTGFFDKKTIYKLRGGNNE